MITSADERNVLIVLGLNKCATCRHWRSENDVGGLDDWGQCEMKITDEATGRERYAIGLFARERLSERGHGEWPRTMGAGWCTRWELQASL